MPIWRCGAIEIPTARGDMLTTHPFDDDKLREECGVFGIWGAESASAIVALGLHALQHRGQEAAGITSWDGRPSGASSLTRPASHACATRATGSWLTPARGWVTCW